MPSLPALAAQNLTSTAGLGVLFLSICQICTYSVQAGPRSASIETLIMEQPAPTLCFTCGLAVEETPRLNRLTNGEICPACRDRVLDMLPAPLPARPSEVRKNADHPLTN